MVRVGNQGFSFIEVVQALAIAAVGLLALSSLTMGTVRANAKARRVTSAATFGADKMESIRQMPYVIVADGSDTVSEAGVTYSRVWTVCTNCPITGTKEVSLEVRWTDHAQERVKLQTVITQ